MALHINSLIPHHHAAWHQDLAYTHEGQGSHNQHHYNQGHQLMQSLCVVVGRVFCEQLRQLQKLMEARAGYSRALRVRVCVHVCVGVRGEWVLKCVALGWYLCTPSRFLLLSELKGSGPLRSLGRGCHACERSEMKGNTATTWCHSRDPTQWRQQGASEDEREYRRAHVECRNTFTVAAVDVIGAITVNISSRLAGKAVGSVTARAKDGSSASGRSKPVCRARVDRHVL